MNPLILFISYSHDSDQHREEVLSLSERLRADGYETRLDQYVKGTPEEKWPRWMLNQLDEAAFVLVVCTETYYRRFRGHEQPDKGKGVDWEGALMTQELYDARSRTLKFVPVLFDSEHQRFIPEPLRGQTHFSLDSEANYGALCDFLDGVSGVEPQPVGQRMPKARREGTPRIFGDSTARSDTLPDSDTAAVQLTEDQQRNLLVGAAVDLLATSGDALTALAGRFDVSDPRDSKKWSQAVVDKLLDGNSPPQILSSLVRTQIELDRRELKSAADVVERVAYYVVPAALTDAHVKQITIIANSKSQKFEFQAKTKTFVEIAVARVNGRETMFRKVASQTDNPSGRLCLAQPAEEGMDANHEKFISSFVAELSQIIGSDLLDRDESQTVRAINAELNAQFELDGWQYYYVFENPDHEAERRKRHDAMRTKDLSMR